VPVPSSGKRSSGVREAAIALTAYGAYLGVRALVWTPRGRERADRHARAIATLERRAHLDIEASVQRAALRYPRAVDALNAGYALGNVALSVGWVIRLWARGDRDFPVERRAVVLAFVGALPFFALLPTAPPRRLEGFVDTLATRGLPLDDARLVRFYNPIAAMPSHHLAFATVTGMGLAARRHSRLGRAWWRAYPAAVAVVVVATANHFVLDVLAGAALGAVARRVTR
jgi:hypothetical protein